MSVYMEDHLFREIGPLNRSLDLERLEFGSWVVDNLDSHEKKDGVQSFVMLVN